MRPQTYDLDALRTFCLGMELGSFAKAAQQLCRSTSAVSAQLKKLEEQAGLPLVRKEGRHLVLTEAGEVLHGYGRRLLELNDEARLALAGLHLQGRLRMGLQEDFSEHLLSDILGRFTRANTSVLVETKVARNSELRALIQASELDLALAWHMGAAMPHMETVGRYPLHWIGPMDTSLLRWHLQGEPVPLVAFDQGCAIRAMAIAALERAGIAWRIAFTSPSLASVWAAVAAGIGITARSQFGMPSSLCTLPQEPFALPELPNLEMALYRSTAQLPAVAERMQAIIRDSLQP